MTRLNQDGDEARIRSTAELRRAEQEALEANFVYRLAELREANEDLRKENQTLKNREDRVKARLAQQEADKKAVREFKQRAEAAEKRAAAAERKVEIREADFDSLVARIDAEAEAAVESLRAGLAKITEGLR